MPIHAQFNLNDVELLETQSLYSNFVQVEKITLRHRLFATQDWSKPIQRELVKRREAAGVLIYDLQLQKILLIEQFRVGALNHPQTAWQLEIIAGLIDGQESAEQCLIREAKEEANCDIFDVKEIFKFYTSSGASNEIFHLYFAQADLSQARTGEIFGQADEGENIKSHVIDFSEIDELLGTLQCSNAPLLLALQQFRFLYLQSINAKA